MLRRNHWWWWLNYPCPAATLMVCWAIPERQRYSRQENHFVFLILQRILATEYSIRSRTVAVAFKLLDRFGELGPAASALPAVFQNASAQELSDVLQFVDGQTLQKAPG